MENISEGMTPTELEKFKKHINKSVEHTFKSGDGTETVFKFKPLTTSQFAMFMSLGKKFNKDDVDPDATKEMLDVYVDIICHSYPGLDKDIAEMFVTSNITEFSKMIEKLMPTDDNKSGTRKHALDEIRRLQKLQAPAKDG